MASLPFLKSFPLDPQLVTGPFRLTGPKSRHGVVTPGTPYGEFATWLYVGVSGNVNITLWDGTTITMVGLVAGVWHPVYSLGVNSAGTTATNILWAS